MIYWIIYNNFQAYKGEVTKTGVKKLIKKVIVPKIYSLKYLFT